MLIRKIIILCFVLLGCTPADKKGQPDLPQYSLVDFFGANQHLDDHVDSIFQRLDSRSRIAQMIVVAGGKTGKAVTTIEKLIKNNTIGGVLMLSGEKTNLMQHSNHYDSLSKQNGNIPLLYSSDAEPSLINRKIKGTKEVPKTIDIKTVESCDSIARMISDDLIAMNIHQNYAPIVDMSSNNEAITDRTFGTDSASVVELSTTFIKATQQKGLVATAKHFPGHGLVSGDTHSRLVAIDGEMREINNYIPLIKQGVISIMVGHIAVINNAKYQTGDFPASCSRVIVTDLLKNELGFKGIVITDAMNMGALREIEDASLKAVEAGCDMILMEPNESKLLEDILEKYIEDISFKTQIDFSVKKILRLKTCLNLI